LGALEVVRAVQAGAQDKMAFKQGASAFENGEDFSGGGVHVRVTVRHRQRGWQTLLRYV
jgi:hypothetical protein